MIVSVLTQGLLYALVATAVYLTTRILSFDDLTVEGSFGAGGALGSKVLLMGGSMIESLLAAMLGGMLLGICTSWLNIKLGINNLIAGLVVTTAVFSVCLGTIGPNVSLMDCVPGEHWMLLGTVLCVALLLLAIRFLLKSEIGFLIRCLGRNPQLLTLLGKRIWIYQSGVLALANGLTAIAGALFVQMVGFYSITANVGTLVIGLSSLILAEFLGVSIWVSLVAGSILYQLLFVVTLELEIAPQWNNLIKAMLIIALFVMGRKRQNAAA